MTQNEPPDNTQLTPALDTLVTTLEGTLMPLPGPQAPEASGLSEHDRLARQGHLLDQIFAQLCVKTNGGFKARFPDDSVKTWLDLALRAQKQYIDTAKAKAAIDYMAHLSTPPPPPKK